MSFAELRQATLQGGALSSVLFAENVTITEPTQGAEPKTPRVKIEHDDMIRRRRGGTASGNESVHNTFDTRERIRVTLSRDPNFVSDDVVPVQLSYPTRPLVGATLLRSEARDPAGDSDKPRGFAFRGELVFEGDQHAVYIFERPRRVIQGKGN
jgi:hypothetical protein